MTKVAFPGGPGGLSTVFGDLSSVPMVSTEGFRAFSIGPDGRRKL